MADKSIIQLHNVEPQQFLEPLQELKKQIEELKKDFQPKKPTEYLTRTEVSQLLKIDISTVHNWTKRGILTSYGIGNRIYYKRKEVEKAIQKLNH